MKKNKLTLSILENMFGICKLDPVSEIPAWACKGSFFSITKTPEELSVVYPESSIPTNIPESSIPTNIPEKGRAERGWSCLKVEGPLDFGLTEILA